MRGHPGWWLVLLGAGAAGCASAQYIYQPEENATASVSGRTAAYYRIPPASPHGDVRVATLGITTLEPTSDGQERVRAMHVRVVVDNNDDTAPWQLDTRQQIASLDSYGQSRPAYASTSFGTPPVISIAPGASVAVDLYYPLPEDMQKASEIPHLSLLWSVQTPEAPVTERTSFQRVEIEPPPSYYAGVGWGYGWYGPGWGWGWYDPFWPDYTFWGAPVVGPSYYSAPGVNVAPPAHMPPPAVRVR